MAAKSKKTKKKGIAKITYAGQQPTNSNFQQDDVRIEEELDRHHLEQLMYWFHVHQPTSAEEDDVSGRRLSSSSFSPFSPSPFSSAVAAPFSQRTRMRTRRRRPGMLTLREFGDVLTKVIGAEIKEKQIENFFNRLDTASDGYVDWNEFCTYMLMQFRERDYVQTLRLLPFQSEAKIKHIVPNKQEPTVKIVSIDSPAKLITISKEGSMCVWSPALHLEKSYRINGTDDGGGGGGRSQQQPKRRVREWVTDAVHLGNCHRLAVASTGRDVRFYDITTADQYYEELHLYGLSDVAVCLNYWFNEKVPGSRSLLLFGDDHGAVHVLYFLKPLRQLFAVPFGKKGEEVQRIYFPDLKYHGEFVSHVRLDMNFVEPIRRLAYLPDNDCVALCTSHSKYSMVLAGVDNKNKSYVFSLSKGVDCFDYSRALNALVTGSSDRMVRLWNAYVITRPVAVLVGHNANVIDVKIVESRAIVISYSREAVVKVWDTKEYVCLQTVAVKFPCNHLGRLPDYGPFPMATTHSLFPKSVLVTANDYIAMLKLGQVNDPVFSSTPLTHKTQLCGAIYNACLRQVVTAADDSSIGVWDAATGAKQMLYTGAHGREEITALALDDTGRRLITGARNGTIKVWNVQNGHSLHQLEAVDETEITGIVCVPEKKSILAVGWSRKITLYNDTEPDNLFIRANTDWKGGHLHGDDILSMAVCPPAALLATASHDGQILVWFLETEILFKKLRKTRPIRTSARVSAMTAGFPQQRSPGASRPNSRHRNNHKTLDGEAPPVDKLLFLVTRAEAKQTEAAILVSSEAGTLRWWSVFGQKTEMGDFRACVDGDDCVLALCTANGDALLITGDTQGKITVWKTAEYCVKPDDPSNHLTPGVASSWNAHSNVVVSVECFVCANSTYLLTASTDNTAKLWTLDGLAIGTFGQKKQWSLTEPLTWTEPPQWAIEEEERRTKEMLLRSRQNTDAEEDVGQENANETDDVNNKPQLDNDIPLNHRKLKRLLSFGPEMSKNASAQINESSNLQDRSKTFAFGSKLPIDNTRVSLGTRVADQLDRVRQDRQGRRRFMEGIDFSRTNRYGTLQCCAYQAVNMPELEEVKNPENLFQSSQFPFKAANNDSSLNSKTVVVKIGANLPRSTAPTGSISAPNAASGAGITQ